MPVNFLYVSVSSMPVFPLCQCYLCQCYFYVSVTSMSVLPLWQCYLYDSVLNSLSLRQTCYRHSNQAILLINITPGLLYTNIEHWLHVRYSATKAHASKAHSIPSETELSLLNILSQVSFIVTGNHSRYYKYWQIWKVFKETKHVTWYNI